MRPLLVLFLFILVLSACKKSDDTSGSHDLNGRFRGTFHRSTSPDTAQVTFNFKPDMTFDGTGGPSYYPSICGGTFQRTNDVLAVNDTCAWTANFDWTLIFDGSYNILFTSENSVRIWKTNGAVTDEYLLNRITR